MEYVKERDDKVHKELHLLRSGSCEWRVKRPVISWYADAGECMDDMASSWRNNLVIPVGNQLLFWVDLARGLLFSDDVFDESPSLWYKPLPEDADLSLRSVCVTADGCTIKFVNVFPRCCCGGAGKSKCRASHHAYAIHTWTLRMDVDIAWVMDGSLDATQLWALDGYKGLPRVELDSPVMSMDKTDAICFVVCERHQEKHGDETMWWIMVDMKSKTLGSVFRYPEGRRCSRWGRPLPSRVSKYFNSKPSTGQPGPAAQTEAMLNLRKRRINNKLQAINSTMQAASPSPDTAILTALQEIPSLDRDELLKAYRIPTHDDSGRRFRALIGLPMDLRKDCVLMEIKASEACVLCSACSADLQIKE
ncbi:unnamed protein product [Miscanthus lutarioriparius]|uniref:DUF1618 domain-containing protein n=1 Tax=Miscanthus lutarioriparius TaxID=422564 RepID=A0A811SKV8_9POAL|nr:unnamed protein product [Miscanthus lutarioriparius]